MVNILGLSLLAIKQVNAQAALGGGQAAGNPNTGSVITTTSYINAPTAAEPPLIRGPWSDTDHLEGTWSSKSMTVFTGPDFYDPVDELLIEPALPGISFSFTKDGYFEQAMYQVSANPKEPKCPSGALTYQHGTYSITTSGKLELYPFEDDGRQLVSDPCNMNDTTQYVLYEQQLEFSKFEVSIDYYHGRYRLDLFQFDGTPLPPMYLVYRPPQMLPTETMNPGVKEGLDRSTKKRSVSLRDRVQSSLINRSRTKARREVEKPAYYNHLWWFGVTLMTVGATGYIYLS